MSSDPSILIKSDQHFLDFPLWVLDERLQAFKKFTVETKQGTFTLTCGERPPDATDALFLYSFMKLAQIENRKAITIKNRSKILRMCGFAATAKNYDRLWESLKRWKNVTANFDGCYYDSAKKQHVKMLFGIIEWAKYDEDTKELSFKFNDVFYEIMQNSKLYRLIDLNYYRMLKRPVSRRLYEILIKHLEQATVWKCGSDKLAERLVLDRSFPSQIIIKLKPAINEINANTPLKVEMTTEKTDDGRTIFVFTRISTPPISPAKLKALKEAASGCWKATKGNCAGFRGPSDATSPVCAYCPGKPRPEK